MRSPAARASRIRTDVPRDPRVRAVAALASGSGDCESPEAEIVAIDVPLLLMASAADDDGVDADVLRPWNLATGRPLYRADVTNARHGMFGLGCDFGESLITTLGCRWPESFSS